MTLDLHATPDEVMRAVEALQQYAQAQGVPEKNIFSLALALEECGSNIVKHAFGRDPQQKFTVELQRAGDVFVIELRDQGPEFDPTLAIGRKPQADDEDLPGGWGIELVRRHVNEIRYRREAGENILRLTKRLIPSAADRRISNKQRIPNKEQIDMALAIQIYKSISGQDSDALTVKLSGSLDTATAPELERQLSPALVGPVTDLVFDLAELKFISSAGLRVFSSARKLLKERGGQTSFIHMQPQIQEVFEIMKSLPGVAVFKDVAELDRYLAARQRAHA